MVKKDNGRERNRMKEIGREGKRLEEKERDWKGGKKIGKERKKI
jgi:hypothetical protein